MLDEDMAEATPGDLHQAAERLGVVLIGPSVASYFSLGSQARRDGTDYWLRVRRCHFLKWVPSRVLGYEDSGVISGVPKPVVVDTAEHWDSPHIVRAELLTYVGVPVISKGLHLKTTPDLPETWWSALRDAVKNLAQTPTHRDTAHVLHDAKWLRAFYATDVPDPTDWATEHEDPHWGNVTGPELNILDWDFWGCQPRGFTVAGLYCTSLAVPEVSERLWHEFADLLDAPSGRWSILYHLWYRRRGLPTFAAWERGASAARSILQDLT
ncbi:MAG: hypothetical protein AUG49_15285 [Catenulispora sp. 13_1_20CM_3_70_7]|nr:MAG: hypothetical protein AUG49_15285 [Catenulispora sp. 13_1_20CM_3_70_7]